MTGLQEQMSSMKCEVSDEQKATNEWLVKRIKLDKVPTFRKKSSEEQFHFNEKVREKLATACGNQHHAIINLRREGQGGAKGR